MIMKRIHLLACVLTVLLLPTVALAKKVKFMKSVGKPLPLQLKEFTHKPQRIDYLCRNSGCHKSAANDKQNAMKNNLCAPIAKIAGPLTTFSAHIEGIALAPPASSTTLTTTTAPVILLGDSTHDTAVLAGGKSPRPAWKGGEPCASPSRIEE